VGATAAHQLQVLVGRAGGAVAGRSLDEIGPDFAADLAQHFLLLVMQETVLEDHFDEGPLRMGRFDDGPDVVGDVAPVLAQDLADVDDLSSSRRRRPWRSDSKTFTAVVWPP
jgi:hypothetical protein